MAKKTAAAKPPKKKKQEVAENRGITGVGTDYKIMKLSAGQKLLARLVGFLIGFAASMVYFNSKVLGVILGVICAYKAVPIYRKKLLDARAKELRLQFRDMLESLSNSYTVGMTASRAFAAAYNDMVVEHGKDAYITKELQLINAAHQNQGYEIKDLLNDFSARSGLEDVRSFAGVFDVSSNLGGDVAKVIRDSRDMIGDKIEVEMEIQTMVTGQRNQLNVLAVMPLVMSLLTKMIDTGDAGALVIGVKIVALLLFVFAYWLGTRIVDIKI